MKKTKNEKGIALISVMILITMLALLAGSLLHIAYLGYTRKATEKKNNENFYCAEAVIDNVKTVLQNAAAVAVPKAEFGEDNFAKYAYCLIIGANINNAAVVEALKTDGTVGADATAIANVKKFLFNKITTSGANYMPKYDVNAYDGSNSTMIGRALTPADQYFNTTPAAGAQQLSAAPLTADPTRGGQGNGGSFDIEGIILEATCVRIKGVSIKYVNDQGFTASIKTDIVINAPKYIKASDAPISSYSMFAGCGAFIYTVGGSEYNAMNNSLYVHQEGNGYFGSMSGTNANTAFVVNASSVNGTNKQGGTIASFDGTNIIFNGDVRVENGGALIFTGGNGKEAAQVQVHGFILLDDKSNLFIAPNVKINCLGIVTSLSYAYETGFNAQNAAIVKYEKKSLTENAIVGYNAAGTKVCTITYTPYSGTSGAVTTASQFYPFTEAYVKSKSSNSLANYYANKEDAEKAMSDANVFAAGASDSQLDSQYIASAKNTGASGVYVLNGTTNANGWANRTGWDYKLVSCTVNSTNWTWSGKAANLITCNPVDEKLCQIAKTLYAGEYYDTEFFNIVNVPLLKMMGFNGETRIVNWLNNYNICDKTTYAQGKTWTTAKTDSSYSALQTWDGSVGANVTWASGGIIKWSQLDSAFMGRKFFKPNDTSSSKNANYKAEFTTPDGMDFYMSVNDKMFSFYPKDNFDTPGGAILFNTALKNLVVRIANRSYQSGILLTSQSVYYGESTGITRVISLLKTANKFDKKIEEEGNPVHEMLEKMGSGLVYYNDDQGAFTSNKELMLVDNMFNEGISIFWKMGMAENGGAADNSDNDLIDVDNWNKN